MKPVKPAPIIAVNDRRRVMHVASGFEEYFGDTPPCADVEQEERTGRWRLDRTLWGDWD
jgi:hypothetical protein